jgi:protein SCO1/2
MRLTNRGIATMAVLLLLTASLACNRTRRYPMQGEIVAKSVATSEITVNHGDIPSFMEAMAMPYRVKDPAVLQQVEPGDKIAAEVVVGNDRSNYWLENVRITDQSGRGKIKVPTGSQMLMPGQRAPDIALVNQDGRKIRLSDFAGKAVLVTFIYTRCPMPNFCPRLSSQFARIHNELKKNPVDYDKTRLLTISFDPKYDTPAVLRKYGLAYLDGDESGFSHWDFVSTDPADLRRLARAFGLEYQEEENQIIHNMSIVLVAPNGTVAKYWSTDWTWTDLMADLQHAAHTTAQETGNPASARPAKGRTVGCPILNFAFFAKFRVGMLEADPKPLTELPHSSQKPGLSAPPTLQKSRRVAQPHFICGRKSGPAPS